MNTVDFRNTFFDGIGTSVKACHSLDEILEVSKINYEVKAEPLYLADGTVINGKFANRRTDNGDILGIVGKNYNIVQNKEGFNFIDDLMAQGAHFETAGCDNTGTKSFIVASTEDVKIMDDTFTPYIVFTNSFDGTGTVKAMFTPIRMVCANQIALATREATQKFSIRHCNAVKDKLEIAKDTLRQNQKYIEAMKRNCEKLATTKFNQGQFLQLVDELIPVSNTMTPAIALRADEKRNQLMLAYNENDVQNYKGTAYQAILAVSDYESHVEPVRSTDNKFIYMNRVLAGMVMIAKTVEVIKEKTGVTLW